MQKRSSHKTVLEASGKNRYPVALAIRYTGLASFYAGLIIFISLLLINDYKLTPQILEQTIDEPGQLEVISAEAEEMFSTVYASQFTFIPDLKNAIASANDNLATEYSLNSYEQEVLRLDITKAAGFGSLHNNQWLYFWLTFGLTCFGALVYFIPNFRMTESGIQNDHIYQNPATKGKIIGITIGTFLIAFYVFLYWYPAYIADWISMVDPLSMAFTGNDASRWFLYGVMYTLAILVMGVRMLIKYRHSNYHKIRTGSVMFFQLAFAFLIPQLLIALNKPYFDFKLIWPLNYDFFYGYNIETFISSGALGVFMLAWGVALILIAVPVFTYFYGKRWYCSWVCGCGGLAETLGDPYRQLSDKSLQAWKVERWMVHSVLVFAILMTAAVLYTYFTNDSTLLGFSSYTLRSWYGFLIGAAFAGVIGVGFYPFMGNRVWCRFGCPLAAYIGMIQRFKSRFRITTNGGQCISCGNCSTYCEMGIDVRWYAQRGQNIIRSSCVGCGVCASVCPRGVLRLENGKEKGRFNEPKAFVVDEDGVRVNGEKV